MQKVKYVRMPATAGETAIMCPVCNSVRQYVPNKDNNYYCVRCGTTFERDGRIIKAGKVLICPSCNRASTRFKKSKGYYCCEACGSEFNRDQSFVAKRSFHPCPQCSGRTITYVFNKNLYRCHRCGTEYKEGFSIVVKRKARPCLVCGNKDTNYRFERGMYSCDRCGSVFTTGKKIITKGSPQMCPGCNSIKTYYNKDKGYRCGRCGTSFVEGGTITKYHKYIPCPTCKNTQSSYRVSLDNFICPKCGTIYLSPTKIIKVGNVISCPLCSNKHTVFRTSNNNYKCYQCGTIFLKNKEIVSAQALFHCSKCKKSIGHHIASHEKYRCDQCGSELDVIVIDKLTNAQVREFYLDSLDSLQIEGMDGTIDEFASLYFSIRHKIQKDTKYRSLRKLGPILLYFFLKTRGILLVLPDFLDLYQLRYTDFTTDFKYMAKIYPEFKERDKKFVIKAYITTILKNLDLDKKTIGSGLTLFDHFYPFIQHTKEEVVAATVCVLIKILFEYNDIYMNAIAIKAGIQQSSFIQLFKTKIYPYLGIPRSATLKSSFRVIKKKLREKFPHLID